MTVELLGRGFACFEEIAYRKGWLTPEQVIDNAKSMDKNSYGQYLMQLVGK